MIKKDNVLLDANILIALLHKRDVHHQRTVQHFETLVAKKTPLSTNNHVIDESLNVLARRTKSLMWSVDLGESIYGMHSPWFRMYRTPHQWELDAFEIFKKQPPYTKETFLSFTDCMLIVQAKRQAITALWTLDACLATRCKQEHIRLL